MNYRQFIDSVKERAKIGSDLEAENAIEATMKTLAERLGGGSEAEQLAAQLPGGIGDYLIEEKTRKNYDLKEFYMKVSERESLGQPMAIEHARAIMSVVEETVTPGELRDVLAQLPEEYDNLFTYGSDWRNLEGR
jgi:uncharacterized protein (DUF2267 family)